MLAGTSGLSLAPTLIKNNPVTDTPDIDHIQVYGCGLYCELILS